MTHIWGVPFTGKSIAYVIGLQVSVFMFIVCLICIFVLVFTAQSSCASAVLKIVILSVRPSVTCELCEEMKEHTADIFIPHERVITLVL